MFSLNLSVKIGLGYLKGGAGFFLCGGPWIEFWWWPCSAMGWNVVKLTCVTVCRSAQYSPSLCPAPWRGSGSTSRVTCTWPWCGGRSTGPGRTRTLCHTRTAGGCSCLHLAAPPLHVQCQQDRHQCHRDRERERSEERDLHVTHHSTEPRHYISTCRARSREGCTGGTCRRSWCSTSLTGSYIRGTLWGDLPCILQHLNRGNRIRFIAMRSVGVKIVIIKLYSEYKKSDNVINKAIYNKKKYPFWTPWQS